MWFKYQPLGKKYPSLYQPKPCSQREEGETANPYEYLVYTITQNYHGHEALIQKCIGTADDFMSRYKRMGNFLLKYCQFDFGVYNCMVDYKENIKELFTSNFNIISFISCVIGTSLQLRLFVDRRNTTRFNQLLRVIKGSLYGRTRSWLLLLNTTTPGLKLRQEIEPLIQQLPVDCLKQLNLNFENEHKEYRTKYSVANLPPICSVNMDDARKLIDDFQDWLKIALSIGNDTEWTRLTYLESNSIFAVKIQPLESRVVPLYRGIRITSQKQRPRFQKPCTKKARGQEISIILPSPMENNSIQQQQQDDARSDDLILQQQQSYQQNDIIQIDGITIQEQSYQQDDLLQQQQQQSQDDLLLQLWSQNDDDILHQPYQQNEIVHKIYSQQVTLQTFPNESNYSEPLLLPSVIPPPPQPPLMVQHQMPQQQ